ncbi:hypothetical protein DERP_010660 [Dermatophagoides pteronyssinus]|uniref:Uncharacterized protein n=1 Tax=Dermatophagoides pteronyssinus TaxID=6956 RepID=A0ABQ8JAN3_DERPT|nr:hypothetical protein DERP_010660 [Dermatophagoides pteronyssinus]
MHHVVLSNVSRTKLFILPTRIICKILVRSRNDIALIKSLPVNGLIFSIFEFLDLFNRRLAIFGFELNS